MPPRPPDGERGVPLGARLHAEARRAAPGRGSAVAHGRRRRPRRARRAAQRARSGAGGEGAVAQSRSRRSARLDAPAERDRGRARGDRGVPERECRGLGRERGATRGEGEVALGARARAERGGAVARRGDAEKSFSAFFFSYGVVSLRGALRGDAVLGAPQPLERGAEEAPGLGTFGGDARERRAVTQRRLQRGHFGVERVEAVHARRGRQKRRARRLRGGRGDRGGREHREPREPRDGARRARLATWTHAERHRARDWRARRLPRHRAVVLEGARREVGRHEKITFFYLGVTLAYVYLPKWSFLQYATAPRVGYGA